MQKETLQCHKCIALAICKHKDPLSIVEKCDYIFMHWVRYYALWQKIPHTNGHETLIHSEPFGRTFAANLGLSLPEHDYILYIRDVATTEREIKELAEDNVYNAFPTYAYCVKPSLCMYIERLKNGTL
jgi:hypothetical protein